MECHGPLARVHFRLLSVRGGRGMRGKREMSKSDFIKGEVMEYLGAAFKRRRAQASELRRSESRSPEWLQQNYLSYNF